jgi:CRP-like cAMP-binding protein
VSEAGAGRRVRLVQLDPDLLNPEEVERADRLTVPVRQVVPGSPEPVVHAGSGRALIVRGLIAQHIRLAGSRSVVMAWDGDMVWANEEAPDWIDHPVNWQVLETAIVADIDEEFLAATADFPGVLSALGERISRVQARLTLSVAVSHLSRVEHRILAVLLLLAEDRGRATVDGLVLRMPLTHERLGELIGARRPTVSLAMRELDALGLVRKGTDGSLVIHPGAIEFMRTTDGTAASLVASALGE